jgi:predicted MFS family arabinose efflux permease
LSSLDTRVSGLEVLRRNRQIRLLFFAQVVSYAGDWFAYVALTGRIHDLTRSNTLVSLVWVLESLPAFLITPVAGSVVDRFDRRRVIIVVSLVQTVAAASMIAVRNTTTVPIAFVCVATISALGVFVGPASQAAIPNLARSPEETAAAARLLGSTWGVMLAVGAALGGAFAAAFGRDAAFLANAASFLAAATFVGLITTAMQKDRGTGRQRVRPMADLRETIEYARHDKVTLALMSSKVTVGIGSGIVGLVVVFARDNLHGGDASSGLLMAARGVGAALGPLAASRYVRDDMSRLLTICGTAGIVFGAGYVLLSSSTSLALGLLAVAIAHFGGGAQWFMSSYGLQMSAPDHIRGRVLAGDFALVTVVLSASGLLAGVISQSTGNLRATMFGFSCVAAVSAVVNLTTTRRLRRSLSLRRDP